eukprot:6876228-Prymnesium_polylepis.1
MACRRAQGAHAHTQDRPRTPDTSFDPSLFCRMGWWARHPHLFHSGFHLGRGRRSHQSAGAERSEGHSSGRNQTLNQRACGAEESGVHARMLR